MWKIIIFVGFLCFVLSIQGLRITSYVCHNRRGILVCPQNTAIQIKYANYGRTSTRYCPHKHMGNTNCRARSSFSDISGLCNMMRVCHVWASHKIFGDPCYGTYKYLETSYECVPIASPLLRSISCESKRKTISCPWPSVIEIRSAHYGRTSRAICVSEFMGNTRCYALSSFRYISDLCNKRRSCVVFASNSVFGDPCFGTYKYLDVRYKCVRSESQCGVQRFISEKIVGGKNAEEGEWPWMVGLYSANTAKPGKHPFCGGTLIRDNVVVTAAHCVRSTSASRYEVRIGDYNINKVGSQEQTVGLSKIYRHEKYNSRTLENDIALLILDKSVKLGGEVQVACLPTKPVSGDAKCYATGWGILKEGGRLQPDILQEVQLPLYGNAKCKESYGKSKITDDMICAGYYEGGKDACKGDSGGPLVCKIPGTNRMELRGITSWGIGCAREDQPGVYARVNYFVENNWITDKLLEHDMKEVEKEIERIQALKKMLKKI